MEERKLKVNDMFLSFQGEGQSIGIPMFFIRFSGCNLSCPMCDTEFELFREMTISRIYKVLEYKNQDIAKIVSLTGGEPLLQNPEDLFLLMNKIFWNKNYRFVLETNATLYKNLNQMLSISNYELSEYIYTINADIKTEKDGSFMHGIEENQIEFFKIMAKHFHNNTLKIVIQPEMVAPEAKSPLYITMNKVLSCFTDKNINISLTPLTQSDGTITQFKTENLFNIYSQVERAIINNNVTADIRVIPQTHRILNIP